MPEKTKNCKGGQWTTLETIFGNANRTFRFWQPAGASIKVRYGIGFIGFDQQKQTLDGISVKILQVGAMALSGARVQIRVKNSCAVTYESIWGSL